MGLLDVLLPHRCPVCGEPGVSPCPGCAAELPPPPALPPPPGLDACVAAVGYRDGGRAVVAAVKFAGSSGPVPWVVADLAGRVLAVTRGSGRAAGLDVVTWVPATGVHRRRRGRDQAEVVARALARRLGVPARRHLVRAPGPPQAGRRAAARRAGPVLAATGRAPPGVLVVDDVVTTGGSMAAAARVLRGAGAVTVVGAAVARTPPWRGR